MKEFKLKTPKEVIEMTMKQTKELESKSLLVDAMQMFRVLEKLVEGNALSEESGNRLRGQLMTDVQTSNENQDPDRVRKGLELVRSELNSLLWQKCPPTK